MTEAVIVLIAMATIAQVRAFLAISFALEASSKALSSLCSRRFSEAECEALFREVEIAMAKARRFSNANWPVFRARAKDIASTVMPSSVVLNSSSHVSISPNVMPAVKLAKYSGDCGLHSFLKTVERVLGIRFQHFL